MTWLDDKPSLYVAIRFFLLKRMSISIACEFPGTNVYCTGTPGLPKGVSRAKPCPLCQSFSGHQRWAWNSSGGMLALGEVHDPPFEPYKGQFAHSPLRGQYLFIPQLCSTPQIRSLKAVSELQSWTSASRTPWRRLGCVALPLRQHVRLGGEACLQTRQCSRFKLDSVAHV